MTSDEKFDRHIERMDAFIERMDTRMERMDEVMVRSHQEFELNREIQNELLARTGQQHREVIARFEDLGEHMREQTQALMRMNERLGP